MIHSIKLSAIFLFGVMSPLFSSSLAADEPILRHAVFFEFKEASSDADVQSVVDTFDALPSKIDEIASYASGKNIDQRPISAGLTHAFLVGFESEEDRAVYLPHPDHQAFVEVLKPHLEKVFVLDFWGQRCDIQSRHLKHAVFLKFKSDADPAAVDDVVQTFLKLGEKIPSVRHLEGGENNSPEPLADGFSHGFIVSFDDEAGLAAYGPSEPHQDLVKKLKPVMEEVRVIDFFVPAK